MNEHERMKILSKIEELGTRVGALAAAAKLIENELIKLQAAYYQQTAEVKQASRQPEQISQMIFSVGPPATITAHIPLLHGNCLQRPQEAARAVFLLIDHFPNEIRWRVFLLL